MLRPFEIAARRLLTYLVGSDPLTSDPQDYLHRNAMSMTPHDVLRLTHPHMPQSMIHEASSWTWQSLLHGFPSRKPTLRVVGGGATGQ